MHPFLQKIHAFLQRLDPQSLAALDAISTIKLVKKGEFLLRQDEICRKSFSIETGIARKFYLHEGKEITTELFFEQDIAVSLDSYCQQKPSREFIQALTDLTVLQTDYQGFQTAKKQNPILVELDLMLTEYHAMWLEERLFQFHTMDATARYLHLLAHQPAVIQYVPLTHIASYLGISLETLSRIRAKV